jgi:integration host factor subunit beta
LTKKDIARAISEKLGLTQLQTKEIVQKILAAIVNTLVEDGRVELRNFGVFEVRRRKPRKARNPRTGENIMVPASRTVFLSPGGRCGISARRRPGTSLQTKIFRWSNKATV